MKLIIKIILGLIVFLIICGITAAVLFFGVNGKEQENDEKKVLAENGEKQALILYQDSRMGLTKKAVELASSDLQKEGYSVTLNHPRSDSQYKVQDYDVIVLASPVYAGQVSTPLLDYAEKQDFNGKKVLVLLTGADLNQTAEIEAVKEKVKGASKIKGIKVDKDDERISNALKELIEG